ncbi:hypothetical protein [Phenylobacterium sp.]|uniref:hypothetical protein n=1 Tax=Phenylobacterium sp. TaxID=1871053 RepID=UPI0035B19FFC
MSARPESQDPDEFYDLDMELLQEWEDREAGDLNELGEGFYSFVEDKICHQASVIELPHPSHVSHPLLALQGPEGLAAKSAIEATAALNQLVDSLQDDWPRLRLVLELANGAAGAGFWLGIQARRAPEDRPENGPSQNGRRRTEAASRARTNWERLAVAEEIWRQNPDWAPHRVARTVADRIGGDVSSIFRSIRKLKPGA